VYLQKNIRDNSIVLVQEGITDAESILFRLVKRFRFLPRWLAGTSATGLSDAYRAFCVASEGYRDFFIRDSVLASPRHENAVRILATSSDAKRRQKYFRLGSGRSSYRFASSSGCRCGGVKLAGEGGVIDTGHGHGLSPLGLYQSE
jgi:hypothetical protein